MRVEGRVRHFVAGKASLAVGKRIGGDKAVKPAQFVAAAFRMAGVAIFDRAVAAYQRSRHEQLRALGEKQGRTQADEGGERQERCEIAAPEAGGRLPLGLRRSNRFVSAASPHHQTPDEKA